MMKNSTTKFLSTLSITVLSTFFFIILLLSNKNNQVEAKYVSMWVHKNNRASLSQKHQDTTTSLKIENTADDSNQELNKKFLLGHREHASLQHAMEADFTLVANNGHQSVLIESHSHDLTNGMFYDGAPLKNNKNKKNHNHHGHNHNDDVDFDGGVGEFIGAPKDATHLVRAHVPEDTQSVSVMQKGKVQATEVSLLVNNNNKNRQAQAQSHVSNTNRTGTLRQLQLVDILTQPTITFLSSGYTSSEQTTFNNDVSRVTDFLQGAYTTEGMDAGPWKRYYTMFNIFSVFEASAESGASFKMGSLHECPAESVGGCRVETVNSNLDCAYGTPLPRVLGCDYEDVMFLAGLAPVSQVVIVLVNKINYGGSGGSGVAVLNRGPDMELTALHQLNHAVGNLGDEYDYGVSGTPRTTMHNCRANNNAWAGWINQGSIPGTSSTGCTFSNLVRPTTDSCLMRRKVSSMCPVCAEGLTKSFYTLKKPYNGAILDLAAPRCPLFGYEVHLRDIDRAEFSINHLFLSKGNVSITWTMPTGGQIAGAPALTIQGSQLTLGPSEVVVSIKDTTGFVSSSQRDESVMSQTVKFYVNRVTALTNCTQVSCTTTRGTTVYFCVSCKLANGCSQAIVPAGSTVQRPGVVIPEQSQANIGIAIGVVTAVGCLILVVGLIGGCIYKRNNVIEVTIIRGMDIALTCATVFFLVALFAVAICAVAYGVISLPRAPIFGEDTLLGGLVVCAALVIISAVTLVSLYLLSAIGLIVPGVIMTIMSIPLIVMAIFSLWVSNNTFAENTVSWMRDSWADKVVTDATTICQVQNYFSCSGYEQSCHTNPAVQYCPASCTYSNHFTDPCLPKFQTLSDEYLHPAAITACVGAFIVAVAGACTLVMAWRLRTISSNAKARRSYRHDPKQPVECVTDDELVALRSEFEKVADPSTGTCDVREAKRFLQDAFGESLDGADENGLADTAHTKGGEEHEISFEEILHVLFPFLDPTNEFHDPRTLTEDEAAIHDNTASLVLGHNVKHEHYIKAAGALSPAQLRDLYLENCIDEKILSDGTVERKYKPHPNFFSIVKGASDVYSKTNEGRMCRGLTAQDLDGLRSLWARLNPEITGDLNDRAISMFFAITHGGIKIRTQEHFARWKNHLDVQARDGVGWPEFCLPFAVRALEEEARTFMIKRTNGELDTLKQEYGEMERLMSRREVADEFGESFVENIFLPGESEVICMRALTVVIRGELDSKHHHH